MAKKKEWKVPLDKEGNLLHWASPRSTFYTNNNSNVDWVEPFEFEAELELGDLHTGRSAKYVHWVDVNDEREYPMFIADLITLVRDGTVSNGRADRKWKTVKRGQNFGIAPA